MDKIFERILEILVCHNININIYTFVRNFIRPSYFVLRFFFAETFTHSYRQTEI